MCSLGLGFRVPSLSVLFWSGKQLHEEGFSARGYFSLKAFGFWVVFEGAHEPRSEDRLAKPPTKGGWKSTGLTETPPRVRACPDQRAAAPEVAGERARSMKKTSTP